jgi:hypothetical protein
MNQERETVIGVTCSDCLQVYKPRDRVYVCANLNCLLCVCESCFSKIKYKNKCECGSCDPFETCLYQDRELLEKHFERQKKSDLNSLMEEVRTRGVDFLSKMVGGSQKKRKKSFWRIFNS